MHDQDQELADFQACLLDVLHKHHHAEEIMAALNASVATLAFRDYISTFEPEMLEVAALLVKKWGVKSSEEESAGLQGMPH